MNFFCGNDQSLSGYEDGVYHCCGKDEGDTCCQDYEQGMCFAYGGIYTDCIAEGDFIDRKIICSKCCDDLVRSENYIAGDMVPSAVDGLPENCDEPSDVPPSVFVCTRCGNAKCGPGENPCNCPTDCTW